MVDFYAEWCGPNRQFVPLLRELAATHAGRARFVEVNIDEATDVTRSYGIHTLPTFLFVESGREKARAVGAIPPEAFRTMVARHVAAVQGGFAPGPNGRHGARGEGPRAARPPRGEARTGRRR